MSIFGCDDFLESRKIVTTLIMGMGVRWEGREGNSKKSFVFVFQAQSFMADTVPSLPMDYWCSIKKYLSLT